jgi:hypothetical protein
MGSTIFAEVGWVTGVVTSLGSSAMAGVVLSA